MIVAPWATLEYFDFISPDLVFDSNLVANMGAGLCPDNTCQRAHLNSHAMSKNGQKQPFNAAARPTFLRPGLTRMTSGRLTVAFFSVFLPLAEYRQNELPWILPEPSMHQIMF